MPVASQGMVIDADAHVVECARTWEFMDRVVDRLRQYDTRWGYNGKRGNSSDPSHDVVDYNYGADRDEGTTNVYIIDVIGEDHAALGSDWDGAIITPRDMPTCLELPRLVELMLARGWSGERVQKILGGNFLRALQLLRP